MTKVYVKMRNTFWLVSLATVRLEIQSSENAINCYCKYKWKCKKINVFFWKNSNAKYRIVTFLAWKYRWQWIIVHFCFREWRTHVGKRAQVNNLSIPRCEFLWIHRSPSSWYKNAPTNSNHKKCTSCWCLTKRFNRFGECLRPYSQNIWKCI